MIGRTFYAYAIGFMPYTTFGETSQQRVVKDENQHKGDDAIIFRTFSIFENRKVMAPIKSTSITESITSAFTLRMTPG